MTSTHAPDPRALLVHGSLEAARARTADRLERLVAFVLAPAVVLVIFTEVRAGRVGVGLVVYGLVQLAALLAIAASGRASFRVRSTVLLGYAFAMFTASTAHFGPTLGQGVIAIAAAVWAGISHGRRGAVVAALLTFVIVLVIGAGQLSGALPAPRAEVFDVTSALGWARLAFVAAAGALGIGWVLTRLLRDYQRVVDGASRARAHASAEQVRVEQTSQRLQQLQRMEAMQRLAKGAGYNISSALSVVLCNAEILARSDDPLEAELATEILDAARNVGKTSRSLQTLGQRGATGTEPASPADLVERLERSLARSLPPSIRFVTDVRSHRRVTMGAESLERVVLNLCVNARDAMPDGGVLTVRIVDGEPAASAVRVEVEDTGTGMSPELQARMFEPFFTTKASRGSGLGLPAVRTLVEVAGGRLLVDSRVGEGTRFTIELPAVGASGEVENDADVLDAARLRVLFVDDDASVRRSVERLLLRAGHDVSTAGDVDGALDMLAMTADFDVLVLDGVLPEGEPLEVVTRFREANPHGKVVVCSGHSREELAVRGLESVADVRLEKPFSRAELDAALAPNVLA